MDFNVTKLESGIKRFVLLLRALRVLRGETNSMYSEVLAVFNRPAQHFPP